uniref:Uncharacterized protein n=1 Tax=Rhizophora mucronata TaxID=61149 RepID=A0A2P2KCZ3_RHIMU
MIDWDLSWIRFGSTVGFYWKSDLKIISFLVTLALYSLKRA